MGKDPCKDIKITFDNTPHSPEELQELQARLYKAHKPPDIVKCVELGPGLTYDNVFLPPAFIKVPPKEDVERVAEYEIDGEDHIWLNELNKSRKARKEKMIATDLFESVMELLEMEACLEEDRNKSTEDENNSTEGSEDELGNCDVCGSEGEGGDRNQLVYCHVCSMGVHQNCYGVPYIPEGRWSCAKCKFATGKSVRCELCPMSNGALKRTTDNGKWVHVACVTWLPETNFKDTLFLESIDIKEVNKSLKRSKKEICMVCQESMGACVKCMHPRCGKAFHATCGVNAKLELIWNCELNENDEFVYSRSIYCPAHGSGSVCVGVEEEEDRGTWNITRNMRKLTKEEYTANKKTAIEAIRRSREPLPAMKDFFSSVPKLSAESKARMIRMITVESVFNDIFGYWQYKRADREGPLIHGLTPTTRMRVYELENEEESEEESEDEEVEDTEVTEEPESEEDEEEEEEDEDEEEEDEEEEEEESEEDEETSRNGELSIDEEMARIAAQITRERLAKEKRAERMALRKQRLDAIAIEEETERERDSVGKERKKEGKKSVTFAPLPPSTRLAAKREEEDEGREEEEGATEDEVVDGAAETRDMVDVDKTKDKEATSGGTVSARPPKRHTENADKQREETEKEREEMDQVSVSSLPLKTQEVKKDKDKEKEKEADLGGKLIVSYNARFYDGIIRRIGNRDKQREETEKEREETGQVSVSSLPLKRKDVKRDKEVEEKEKEADPVAVPSVPLTRQSSKREKEGDGRGEEGATEGGKLIVSYNARFYDGIIRRIGNADKQREEKEKEREETGQVSVSTLPLKRKDVKRDKEVEEKEKEADSGTVPSVSLTRQASKRDKEVEEKEKEADPDEGKEGRAVKRQMKSEEKKKERTDTQRDTDEEVGRPAAKKEKKKLKEKDMNQVPSVPVTRKREKEGEGREESDDDIIVESVIVNPRPLATHTAKRGRLQLNMAEGKLQTMSWK